MLLVAVAAVRHAYFERGRLAGLRAVAARRLPPPARHDARRARRALPAPRRRGRTRRAACSSGRRCPTTSTRPTCWRARCSDNVAFVPGRAAYLDGRGGSSMRLNFSGVDEDDIREGIRRIGEVVARAGRALRHAHRPAARAAPPSRAAGAGRRGARRRAAPAAARATHERRATVSRSPSSRAAARSSARCRCARARASRTRSSGSATRSSAIDVGHDLVARLREAAPDAAFVALHGRDGEDGTVQELLEIVGIPYTGSRRAAPACAAPTRSLAKHALRDAGIPTPDFFAFSETAFKELGAADALPAIEERLGFPIVVKPADQGSRAGHQVRAATRGDVPGRAGRRVLLLATGAARAARRRPRPRGLDPRRTRRCRSSRRCRAARTSTTSRRATRSGAPSSSARPSSTPR